MSLRKEDDGIVEEFIRGLPKAELHMHVEGSLEPEMMFQLAKRNGISIRYGSVEEVRASYRFADLESFLRLYYEGVRVLLKEQDFYDLTRSYLEHARQDNVRHAEIFFDPQMHTDRGVPFAAVISGIHRALEDGRKELGMSSGLILCFLRHLPNERAMDTLERALPFKGWLAGVGLDSSEMGHPPKDFVTVFARAREQGLRAVAHAGEEGPPDYVRQALDLLRAERIDHGVRSIEDPDLVARLRREQVPLTVCPLSNVCLRVFPSMKEHNLKRLLEAGLLVTVNSDDPAYFGGYVTDNYVAAWRWLGLSREEIGCIAANGFKASFLTEKERRRFLDEVTSFTSDDGTARTHTG